MRLKRLELAGFKSFARPTRLEFGETISAVVGPNGSGKSNVAEALRWVLGEQSLKTLRGKKGEDLIFNGSQSAPKLGKASVTVTFDNKDKIFPIEYDELIITRKVFRDGLNEYFINGSKARLKDIIEILSNAGLGTSQHHIISQGEADRILNSTPKERRQMIEDALGLKIYQLKRAESERKLLRTKENIKQVESLQKEIQPHLKFLSKQVLKYEQASSLRQELKTLYLSYFSKEGNYIKDKTRNIAEDKKEPLFRLKGMEEELANIRQEIEEKKTEKNDTGKLLEIEKELSLARSSAIILERELGRYEGMLEVEEKNKPQEVGGVLPRNAVQDLLESVKNYLRDGEFDKAGEVIDKFLNEITTPQKTQPAVDTGDIKLKFEETLSKLKELRVEENNLAREYELLKKKTGEETHLAMELEHRAYATEKEANVLRNTLRDFEIEEERLRLHKEEVAKERVEAERLVGTENLSEERREDGEFSAPEREEIKRNINRLKIKLEDSGSVGEETVKEFEEVKKREDFFIQELADLHKALETLDKLMSELDEKIEHTFREGLVKINKELSELFGAMFGGGKAELQVLKPARVKKERDDLDEPEEDLEEDECSPSESGIEILVNLPRKKIHAMTMLSGGERALTSIALLFAMSRVNPPPFLVLDETDAALDESNSVKYGKMLKGLSAGIQLIVITHNRETMSQAGLLYGVTMSSDSISRILSIKLSDIEEK